MNVIKILSNCKAGKSLLPHIRNGSRFYSSSASKVYELRVYKVIPKDFKSFMELTNEWIHLRTNHSPLLGYWVSEIGGINDVVHIWEYDSLEQRAKVRQALSEDSYWLQNYISKMMPMLVRQENSLLHLVGQNNMLQKDLKGVYEIEEFPQCPVENLQNATKGEALLLGTFKGIIGPVNAAYRLWYHKTVDDLVKNNAAANQNLNPGWYHGSHSRLLLPTKWSPLK